VDIELIREKEAENVDTAARMITFVGGEKLGYDSLLIATGGTPRKLPFQTEQQKNVYMLRSFADADVIIAAAASGKRVVIVGSSFIGMEAASSLRQRGCEVTVVTPDEAPMMRILGTDIGKEFQRIHEQQGVKFRLRDGVKNFEGGDDVKSVNLQSGDRIETDLVVVGIGVKPASGFLHDIDLHEDGGVIADYHMQIADQVFAAGDIAHVPDFRTGESVRIEHWRTALQQGRAAAHNMAGKRTPFTAVPFFWTTQFDATLNYVGHALSWDEIIVHGEIAKHDFLAFYIKDFRVLAAAGMNRDRELAILEELMRLNRMPSIAELRSGSIDLLNDSKRRSDKAVRALF
jgi:NADPH-dependent 2,4-dienoyl-CoA reductase/sulfur reductase-like enzyme